MAKKKSKDDWKKEGEALKEVVIAAKKKPQNFALVELKEGMSLCAHALHPISKLMMQAKNADGAKKANCITGKLKLNGKQFVFDCLEAKLPGGMDVKFKQYLKKADHGAFKAVFNVAEEEAKDANIAEEEETPRSRPRPGQTRPEEAEAPQTGKVGGFEPVAMEAVTARAQPEAKDAQVSAKPETEPAQAQEEEEAAQPAQAPELSKEKLTQDITHITEVFKLSFEGMDEAQTKEIKGALRTIAGSIKSGDLQNAQSSINKLGLLTGVTPQSPLQPITLSSKGGETDEEANLANVQNQKRELTKAFADLKPDLKRSLSIANPEHKAALQKLVSAFGKEMKSNDMSASAATFEAFKEQIAAFDMRRSEGVKARKSRMDAIKTRVEEMTKRLEELDSLRKAA